MGAENMVPFQVAIGDCVFDVVFRSIAGPMGIAELSPLETQVLVFLLGRVDEDVSLSELALGGWRHRAHAGPDRYKKGISSLRRKLAIVTSIVRIEVIRGYGYRMSVASEGS